MGKCSGSIRSIARHPELPVLASCGECLVSCLVLVWVARLLTFEY